MNSSEERTWPGRVGGEVNASLFEALASAGRQLLGQVDRDGALDGVRHVDDELVGVRESRSRMKNKERMKQGWRATGQRRNEARQDHAKRSVSRIRSIISAVPILHQHAMSI